MFANRIDLLEYHRDNDGKMRRGQEQTPRHPITSGGALLRGGRSRYNTS